MTTESSSRSPGLAPALIAAAAAFVPAILLRGFTVDDAFIPARYAAHIAAGAGYRFNLEGPVSDGVTPLPWAPILAMASAGGGTLRAFSTARIIGVVCWVLAAALLGRTAERAGERGWRFSPLVVLLVSAPLGAWSVAGLETGLVTAMVTAACALPDEGRSRWAGVVAAGMAAAFRPELGPMACVIALGRGIGVSQRAGATAGVLALVPLALVTGARLAIFGRPFPLALLAKPSDLAHGAVYAVSGLLLLGAPALAFAPVALLRDRTLTRARWLILAALTHVLAVILAGGDWMPLSRLLVPAIPPLLVAAMDIAERAPAPWTALRTAIAVAGMAFAWAKVGAAAANVLPVRAELIATAKHTLAGSRVIAALDVGWVGAATEATIVDLAGVTDLAVASLPGGHTSKAIPSTLLDARGVDTLVFLRKRGCAAGCVRPDGGPFDRVVEERLSTETWVSESFSVGAILRAGTLTYVVMRRKTSPSTR